jgi:hypothetical protein
MESTFITVTTTTTTTTTTTQTTTTKATTIITTTTDNSMIGDQGFPADEVLRFISLYHFGLSST